MKYNLLGAVSTIALGAAFGFGTPGAANAALSCSAGNVIGPGTCSESVFGVSALTPAIQALSLDKWVSNASAGFTETLTGVKFNVREGVFSTGSVTNTDTVSFNLHLANFFTLTASNGSGAPSNFLSPAISQTQAVIGPTISMAAGATTAYAFGGALGPASRTVSGSLAGFIGPGTFSALISAILGSTAIITNPGGNASASITTTASPTIQLTYTFTTAQPPPPPSPTPEPASLALLGAGLAGLGAVRRRRKS
jgi:PEP-CTERM motif